MDVQHSPPKGWKAFQANFDFVFSQSDRLCTVCLSQQQIQALLSQTEVLYWPTRWVRAEGEIDQDFVRQFTEDLERQLLMACCDDNLPIQYRYSDTGNLQRSLNGGGTWMDAPEYDVRVNSPQFPAIPGDDGSDKKCAAATGAATLVKEQVGDQITGDMTRYTFNNFIHDWTHTVVDTSNPFTALVTVISNQIFALVLSALIAALTSDVYHIFACALYSTMADDGSFNNAQWAAARTKILSDISGIAGVFLEHLIYLIGTQGTTNLVRSAPDATGDCSDCSPNCGSTWTAYPGYGDPLTFGSDIHGNYVQGTSVLHAGVYYVIIRSPGDENDCCSLGAVYNADGSMTGIAGSLFTPCGTIQNGAYVNFSTPGVECNTVQVQCTAAVPVRIYLA